ncbi:citrate lyase holo-[acyl-carrier protein] synthase [Lactovum odontotermitis]
MKIFSTGKKVTLEEVLKNKEWRVDRLSDLAEQFPQRTLVSVKLNIPGPIKNNPYFQQIFLSIWPDLTRKSQEQKLFIERKTGPEGFLVCRSEADKVKQEMITIEENQPLGRLFDLDVYDAETDRQISRSELGLPARKCFICERPAKECARSQRHSKEEITQEIEKICEDYFDENDECDECNECGE